MSQKELRRAVERRLEEHLPEKIWSHLIGDRAVSEALTDWAHKDPVTWLALKAKGLMDLSGAPDPVPPMLPTRRQRRYKNLPLRREAISDILAAEARRNFRVRMFRSQYLSRGLLTPSKAVAWIKKHASSGPREQAWIVVLPESVEVGLGADGWRLHAPQLQTSEVRFENPSPAIVLEFVVPGSAYVHRIPVPRKGVLRELYYVSDTLKETFGWQQAQATSFVLTDCVPLIDADKVALQQAPHLTFSDGVVKPANCLTRFVITVESRTAPAEVAEIYRKARMTLLPRIRNPGEKHLTLASFVSQHSELNKGVMLAWNKRFPNWKYDRFSLFSRDAKTARHRLLFGPTIDRARLNATLPRK